MDKPRMEIELYETLKDDLEFDSDVLGMVRILKKMLQENSKEAIKAWVYLFNNYAFKDLRNDIDIEPLIKDFSIDLIKQLGVGKLGKIRSELKKDNVFLIDEYVFNCYQDSSIRIILEELIIQNNQLKEKEILIELKKNANKLSKEFFDFNDLLKLVINWHIKYDKIDKDFLFSLIDLASSKKDKALLSTLLIDYI